MLATRHRLPRNPLFQFHPMHTLFSVLGALILFGLLIWFLAVPARVERSAAEAVPLQGTAVPVLHGPSRCAYTTARC